MLARTSACVTSGPLCARQASGSYEQERKTGYPRMCSCLRGARALARCCCCCAAIAAWQRFRCHLELTMIGLRSRRKRCEYSGRDRKQGCCWACSGRQGACAPQRARPGRVLQLEMAFWTAIEEVEGGDDIHVLTFLRKACGQWMGSGDCERVVGECQGRWEVMAGMGVSFWRSGQPHAPRHAEQHRTGRALSGRWFQGLPTHMAERRGRR